jgi:hypothetical protein
MSIPIRKRGLLFTKRESSVKSQFSFCARAYFRILSWSRDSFHRFLLRVIGVFSLMVLIGVRRFSLAQTFAVAGISQGYIAPTLETSFFSTLPPLHLNTSNTSKYEPSGRG